MPFCEDELIQPAGSWWIKDHKLRRIVLKMRAKAKTAKKMFELLDSDGSGALDSKEMAMGLFRLGVWLHPKELHALMDELNKVIRA